jgi:hypothetical protein
MMGFEVWVSCSFWQMGVSFVREKMVPFETGWKVGWWWDIRLRGCYYWIIRSNHFFVSANFIIRSSSLFPSSPWSAILTRSSPWFLSALVPCIAVRAFPVAWLRPISIGESGFQTLPGTKHNFNSLSFLSMNATFTTATSNTLSTVTASLFL